MALARRRLYAVLAGLLAALSVLVYVADRLLHGRADNVTMPVLLCVTAAALWWQYLDAAKRERGGR